MPTDNMENNVLITGGSGYLGGTLLSRLKDADLPKHGLYALVRSSDQAKAVKQYGAESIEVNLNDEEDVRRTIVGKKINIVFFLINAFTSDQQSLFIKALAELKKATGQEVHFLHTSGAKLFSDHSGAPTDRPFPDNDPTILEVQKNQKAMNPMVQTAVGANVRVVEESERQGVRSYIFLPCIVYGKGEGFGNPISIQTVAMVRAAKGVGQVYKFQRTESFWPVCHVVDTIGLYICMLQKMLKDEDIGYGPNGYYLAASGSVSWDRIYSGIALHMARRGLLKDTLVPLADEAALQRLASVLNCPKELVPLQIAGNCALVAKNGYEIGWKPLYPREHILQYLDEEVASILAN